VSTKTILFEPPVRQSNIEVPIQKYLFSLQGLHPLVTVDTSGGSYAEELPPAGVNPGDATGQSNQNMEITFVKTSADGNTYTITGVESGSVTLTTQWQKAKVKSDGTFWYQTG